MEEHEQSLLLATLANLIVMNNQATQDMIHRRYDQASQTLVQALEMAQALLAHSAIQPLALNASVEINIEWASTEERHSAYAIFPSLVFTKPLVLHASPSQEVCNVFEHFLRPIAFSVVVNLGICRHMQALRYQDTMTTSSNDMSLFGKAVELYLQAGNISKMFPQRTSHFELILLNNLGHAYDQLQCTVQTQICLQSLSIAAAEFKRDNDLYTCSPDIQYLVDDFLRREEMVEVANFTFAAPVA
eukprot:Nitzschia sp. Nitz4//scaffold98_size77359//24949//25683//NITZ4_005544-RA/size77359-processed-gene-0.37-mRNA-1//-1//CDS//3329560745//9298//frame0